MAFTAEQIEAHERLRRKLGQPPKATATGCLLPSVLAVIVIFFVFFSPRTCVMHLATEDQMALEQLKKCQLARDHLGDDIHPAWAGCSTGKSSCSDFKNGSSSWRFPVSGTKGSARLHFTASQRKGKWRLVFATLHIDEDNFIDLMSCEARVIPD